jgi:hypothetical protein
MRAHGARLEVRLETLQAALDQVCEVDGIGRRPAIEDFGLDLEGGAELRSSAPVLPPVALPVPDVVRALGLVDPLWELPIIQQGSGRRAALNAESPGRILAQREGRGIRPGHSQPRAYVARADGSGLQRMCQAPGLEKPWKGYVSRRIEYVSRCQSEMG